jgi:sucrose-phosphate synthase
MTANSKNTILQLAKNPAPKRHCILISLHGLIRSYDLELGKDSDTGGQVKYVVELANALSTQPSISRVDLLTRYIADPNVHESYSVREEPLFGCKGNGFITRLECGPPEKYLRKELLWPYIQEFTDNAIKFINNLKDTQQYELYIVHGHYADAGEIAVNIGNKLNVDIIFTAHSLGRNKLAYLLKHHEMTSEEIEEHYNISRRIQAEETVLDNASIIICSTEEEVKNQWGLYNRGRTRNSPKMITLTPGIDLNRNYPKMLTLTPGIDFSKCKLCLTQAKLEEWYNITHFLTYPHKPIILVICRPDRKKNIEKMVTIYGENKELQDIANIVMLFGNRDDIDNMSTESKYIVLSVLKLIDKYNLYGKIAYPKKHTQQDISDLYLLASHTRGVFVNIALQEPFGLTIIEAAAHGVPVVATNNGGPVEILKIIQHGILVDPTDGNQIRDSIIKIITNPALWSKYSNNARQNVNAYSWETHRDKYFQNIKEMKQEKLMLNNQQTDTP